MICEYCGDDFQALEDLRSHIADHFPQSPTLIGCASDHIEFVPPELPDNVKYNLTDDLQRDDGGSQSSLPDEDNTPPTTNVEDVVESDKSDDEICMQQNDAGEEKEPNEGNVSHRLHCTRKSNMQQQHVVSKNTIERPFECEVCVANATRRRLK